MPAGAEPITSYLRTYYPNGDKIVGQYLLGSQTGIRSLPARDTVVMDGGCSVVTVQYDPTTDQAEETFCNGVA